MRLDRKKNAIRSTIWGVISRIIAIIGPFIIRTIIINNLGQEYLGLSSLFTSILQILSLAELGFSSAIAYSMYEPIAQNDNELICALLNLFKKVYKIVGLVILAIGILLTPFLKLLINGDVPTNINVYLLYSMYLANTSISYLLFAYNGVIFSAFQREDITNKIYSGLMVIQYLLQIIVLMLYKNYYLYYVVVPIVSVLNNIITFFMARKIYPMYVPKGRVPDRIAANIKEKLKGVLISKFCGLTRNTFDSVIISTFMGLTTVAIYSNYYYILSNISAMLVIIVTSMRAGIGNSIAIDSEEKNYHDFNKFTFLYMWIASICSICLLCLYQPFMRIWTGEKNMFPFTIVILLVVYFWGLALGDMIDAYSGAVGLWWENRHRTIIEAVTNLVLNIIMGYLLGIYGIVISTVMTIYIFNFFWKLKILYKYYFKSYKIKNYVMKICYYAFVTIISGVITLLVTNYVIKDGIIYILLGSIICFIVTNLIYVFFYRKLKVASESKDFLLNLIKSKIR